jgi:hypothetical protein
LAGRCRQASAAPGGDISKETQMKNERSLTIHFMDSSKLSLRFPKQTANEHAAVLKLKEVLNTRQLLVEADGALLVIPFENIKYIQAYPAPKRLPETTVVAASVS